MTTGSNIKIVGSGGRSRKCLFYKDRVDNVEILWFGQQEWSGTWTEKQQLSTRLARRGHRVLYIDPVSSPDPLPAARAIRSIAARDDRVHVRRTGPNGLSVFSYRYLPPLRWRGNQLWRARALRSVIARQGFRDPLAVVMIPSARRTVESIATRASAYYAVDEWTSFQWSEDERRQIRADEEALVAGSEIALAVSERLVERFRSIQPHSHLLDNAADIDHFSPSMLERAAPLPELQAIEGPILGYLGQLDDRFDQKLIAAVAARNPAWQIVIVGKVRARMLISLLQNRPNIHFVPFKEFHELPSVLKHFDVCLIPYRDIERSHSCSPSKAFEYLATGKPIVATPIRTYATVRHVLRFAEGVEAWETAIREALSHPGVGREERLVCARRNGWEARVDRLEDLLEEIRRSTRGADPTLLLESPRRPAPQAASAGFYGRIPLREEQEGVPAKSRLVHIFSRLIGRVLQIGNRGRKVSRILVARRAWLGDLVVMLPALRYLRWRHPEAHITLAGQAGIPGREVLEEEKLVDEVVVLDFLSAPALKDRLAGAWKLLMSRYDVTLTGSRHMLLLEGFLSGSRHHIGLYDGSPWQRRGTRILPRDSTRHEVESNLLLAQGLSGLVEGGRESGRPSAQDGPWLPTGGSRELKKLLEDLEIPAAAPLVAMHTGAKRSTRRWPSDRFAALAERLLRSHPDLHVVWTGVENEADEVEMIRQQVPIASRARAHSVAGRTGIDTLIALLRHARVVVSGDTGAMHVARAVGTPLVALLGPGEPRRWSPAPNGPGPAVALRAAVPCAPCLRDSCSLHYCMRALDGEVVFTTIEELLERDRADATLGWKRTNWSWGTLQESGFALPLVAVPSQGAAVDNQTYPGTIRWPESEEFSSPAPWRDLVSGRAEFVALGSRPEGWRAEALALAVAGLVREPEGDAVTGIAASHRDAVPGFGRRPLHGRELADLGLVVARATSLAAFLNTRPAWSEWDPDSIGALAREFGKNPRTRLVVLDEPLRGPR